MKVIITGGTGLIGRALAASLIDDHHQAIILTRDPEKTKDEPSGVQLVKWDGQSAEGWAEHLDGADAVVNLAGASIDKRWTPAHKQLVKESRVKAGEAVTAAITAAKKKPKVLTQASAVGYYGSRGDEIITEESTPGDDFLAGVCQAWEESSKGVEDQGVRRVVIRTGIVLSTKGGALARLLPVYRAFAGGPAGSGKQYMPWIHISDEINAIRFLIENEGASGVFNLAAPDPITNKTFSKTLGRVLNRPSAAIAPGFVMRLVFGEMATIILDGQRAIPQHLRVTGYEFRFTELETALRHLVYSGFGY